ncbi:thiopeptide-type bacteriocin biosynthesis domain-containing protein [Priestia megaterium]|nr:thiopeptide-type bacteriocin biosynthesis domain-containing protein [Priestia megaterium]
MPITKERIAEKSERSSQHSLYQALDFFMLRTPVFPLDNYIMTSSISMENKLATDRATNEVKDYIKNAVDNPIFREAIAVASLPLYKSLGKLGKDNSKKAKQVFNSLLSYYIRMSVRPTPFGLFSGVALGKFAESTEITLNKNWSKRSRPDMQWLCKVVKILEQDEELLSNLLVQKNHLLYKHGEMLILPYLSSHGIKEDSTIDNASFRITPVIEDVVAFTSSPIKFKDLLSKIHNKYQEVSKEKIAAYLYSMVDKEFLITELRPSLLGTSPFEQVIKKVELLHPSLKHNQLYHKLIHIKQCINEYNCSDLGEGENLYIHLTEEMMSVASAKHALQVDLKTGTEKVHLNNYIKQDIEKAGEILSRLSFRKRGSDHMEQYYNDFLEIYGYYSEVPLLELLDSGLGLGAPPTYLHPPSLKQLNSDNKNMERDFILSEWVTNCLASRTSILELTEEMIEKLEQENNDPVDAPDSFDIYFTVASESQESIDRKDYKLIIGPNGGSFSAGKTFGRFTDILGNDTLNHLKQINSLEKELNPNAIFAEVSYLPSSSRVANVMLAPSIREYEIPIGANSSKDNSHTLNLSDLVVGASSGRLYLKSKSLNKEVIPVTGHMVNHMNGVPNIYRFLLDIGYERQRIWEPFNWGGSDQLPFLPRVQYENIILSPATWKFNKFVGPFQSVSNETDWETSLEAWREMYMVPRYINLTDFDNRILLDLDNKVHQQFIYQKFSKLKGHSYLIFTEMGFSMEENWVRSKDNQKELFTMEAVFPLVKRTHYQENEMKRNLVIPPLKRDYISKAERFKNVGSDWLYIKLYGSNERIDELIYTQIKPFCQHIKIQDMAQKSFFMRYADPKSHIRLRFHGDPQILLSKLLPQIHAWVLSLVQQGLVDEIKLDYYNPEIERYGGLGFIGFAEELFSVDSLVSAEIISWLETKGKNFNKNLLAVISIIHILESVELPRNNQFALLNQIVSTQKQPQEFRENKKLLLQLCDSTNNWANLRKHQEVSQLFDILSIREESLKNYFKRVFSADIDMLTNHPDDIMNSVIHLHLNRLGIHSLDEEHVMKLAKFTIQSLIFSKEK